MKTTRLFPTIILFTAATMFAVTAFAQVKVGDNPTTINSGSALEVESTNKGFMLPRLSLTNTTTWGLLGTSEAGMQAYNTNAGIVAGSEQYPVISGGTGVYYWDGNGWVGTKQEAFTTGNSQTLRIPCVGYTSSNGLVSTTTKLSFNTPTFNNIQGAAIVGNDVVLPAGTYRVGLTVSGQFNGASSTNAALSSVYLNGVIYQRLAGYTSSANNGSAYYGVAIVNLEASGTISFYNFQQTVLGQTFTVAGGSVNTVATIERLQ